MGSSTHGGGSCYGRGLGWPQGVRYAPLSLDPSVRPSVRSSSRPIVRPPIHPFIHPSIHPSIYLFVIHEGAIFGIRGRLFWRASSRRVIVRSLYKPVAGPGLHAYWSYFLPFPFARSSPSFFDFSQWFWFLF